MKRSKKAKTGPAAGKAAQRPAAHVQDAEAKLRADQQAEWHAQLAEERTGSADADAPGHHPVGAASSANSVSADPFARSKALGAPVPQVTRHI